MRTCRFCRTPKPLNEFYKRGERNRSHYRSECKQCCLARTRANRAKNPERDALQRRRTHLRQSYGISDAEYQDLLEMQGGVCAICLNKPSAKLHVDHDHSTGTVRGLLCKRCNLALGLLDDNGYRMLRAAQYMRRW